MPNSRLYFGDATGGITASNVGSGTGIFLAKVDKDLQFKTLIAGSNVSFNVDGETITINATDAIGVEGGINLGTGTAIFSSRVGSNLEFKTINAGANVTITSDADSITISATDAIGVEGATNLGAGTGLYSSRVGSDLQFKSINAGPNVTITSDADSITISATDAIGVEGATNLGSGEGLFSSRIGSNLEFKSLVAGTNISLSSTADSVVINATGVGEVNTASNIGAGEGLFAQKVGVDLEFKSLASNDYIQISADASTVILSLPVIDELYESISFLQSDVNILEGSVSVLQIAVADLQALQSEYLLLDGTRTMTGILDLGNYNISNVQNPVNPQDAATKAYVDAISLDITDLENRVIQLEADVITINDNILAIQSDLNSLQGQILDLNLSVSDLIDAVAILNDLQDTYLLLDGTRAMTGNLVFNTAGFAQVKTSDGNFTQGMSFKSGDASTGDSGIVAVGSGDAPSGVAGDLFLFSGVGAAGRGMVQVEASKLNVLGYVDMNLSKIVNLQDPTDPQDAATKAYVDANAGEANTASNVGTGEGLFKQKVGVDLEFKSLIAGSNITLSPTADSVVITALNPGGDITDGQNLGAGEAVFDSKLGSDLLFKTLVAGTNISLVSDAETITISSSDTGEVNTASNIGTGSGLFAQKIGTDLQFKSIIAGSNITITEGVDSITISSTGGGGGNPFDYVQFNLTPASVPADPGVLFWDQADGNQTLSLNMAGGNVVQQIGQEIYIRIKASAAIQEGQVVMITGAVGTSGVYEAAPAQGVTDGNVILGIATENIAFNDFGYITELGVVRGIITDGTPYGETWNDGDELFWNPNPLYPGGLTNVKPSAPNVKASVGSVLKASNGSSGSIYVRLNPGSELGGTDSNVEFGPLNDADFILYNAVDGYWTNVTTADVKNILSIGAPLSIGDEGVEITPQAVSINFTGAGVTATSDINGNVTVDIPGGSGGGITGASNTSAINGVFLEQQGTTLVFKTIQSESTNIQITDNGAYLGVSTLAEVNQADNTGPTNGVFFQKQAETLVFKTIESESPNIQITDNGTYLGISCLAIDSAINLGTGVGVFSEIIGSELQFKSLSAGMNIIITDNGDSISIDASVPPSIITVEDNGVAIESSLGILNFTGSGVSVTSNGAGTVTVDITGGGGGGSYADIPIGPSLDIDWALGTTYFVDISANANFTFSNLLDGKTITVIVNNITSTNYVASFPSTKQGPGGLDNNLYANSATVYTFTRSNGVTYCSSISGVV